MKQTYMRAWIL